MQYDIIHFEALGREADYLEEITDRLVKHGVLPKDFNSLITPLTIQDYLKENEIELPDIITTKTHSILPNEYIENGNKKSVITRSAGYDHFEHLEEKINLTSLREYCVDAVAQTAIKFVYCVCGNLNEYTRNTKVFERKKVKSFLELNENRVATVYGVGKIGKRVYENLKNNGLFVQAVDIRADELKTKKEYENFNFVSREDAILNSDIIVNVMNLTKNEQSRFYNKNYFSKEYLMKAQKPIYFVNVTRGEIAPESNILELYKNGKIVGIGVDVFSHESELTSYLKNNDFSSCTNLDIKAAKEIIDCSLNNSENFYVQPHQGFNSDLAALTKAKEAMNHVVYWINSDTKKFKEQLPYYK